MLGLTVGSAGGRGRARRSRRAARRPRSAAEARRRHPVPRPPAGAAAPAGRGGPAQLDPETLQGRYVAAIHRAAARHCAATGPSCSSARTSTGPTRRRSRSSSSCCRSRRRSRSCSSSPAGPRRTRPAGGSCRTAQATLGDGVTEIRLQPLTEADSRDARSRTCSRSSRCPKRSATRSSPAPRAIRSSSRRSSGCSSSAARSSAAATAGWPTRRSSASRSPRRCTACCSPASTSCPDEAKRSLRVAAVIGRQFPVRVLERVLDTTDCSDRHMTRPQLDTLEAKGLIRLATFQPELEYLFRHALVQDTAYGSLLKQERRELHRLVGDALEELYPDRARRARGGAGDALRAGGRDRPGRRYLHEAAQFAFDRNALAEAFDLYGRAAALLCRHRLTRRCEPRRRRVEIELGQAQGRLHLPGRRHGLALIEPLVEQSALGDLRLVARCHMSHRPAAPVRAASGRIQRAAAEASLRSRRPRSPPSWTTRSSPPCPKSIVGLFQVFTGASARGRRDLEPRRRRCWSKSATSSARRSRSSRWRWAIARLGEFDKADAAVRRARKVAEGGDLIARIDSLIGESTVAPCRGDLEAAVPLRVQCTALAEEAGATACVVASNFVLGDAYMRQGKFAAAKIAFDRSDEVAQSRTSSDLPAVDRGVHALDSGEHGRFRPGRTILRRGAAESAETSATVGARPPSSGSAPRRRRSSRQQTERRPDAGRLRARPSVFEDMGARPYPARVLARLGTARCARAIARGRREAARALGALRRAGHQARSQELRDAETRGA